MSGLAGIYNIPSNEQTFEEWSFNHAANHRDVNAAILRIYGIALPEYILDPFTPGDENWIYSHQTMHNNQDAILGISGYDLTDVNFQDQGQLAGFIYLNADEHRQACDILGIG